MISLWLPGQKNDPNLQTDKPTIFLPGWGFDGRIIELAGQEFGWLYPAQPVNPETVNDDLLAFLAQQEILGRVDLVGWSMGANLAVDFARANPERISTLYLLSMRQQWPVAEIEVIRAELIENPHEFLSGFYRKCFLGYKKAYKRFVEEMQEKYLRTMDFDVLLNGLRYLQGTHVLSVPGCEVHSIHGRRDMIAPIGEMAQVAGSQIKVLDHAGHPVFMDNEFSLPEKRRKKAIRQRFSKAASTYDAHAEVQKELAQTLASCLEQHASENSILEVGCGTGNYTALLARKYPHAQIVGVDFSLPMLMKAQKKLQSFQQSLLLVCEDGENFLASSNHSFSLITANSTMQWFDNIDTAFANIKRVLKQGGVFWGTIFGPQTLHELGEGMAYVFGEELLLPSSRFFSEEKLYTMLYKHFGIVEISEWNTTREYATMRDLLHHIRMTGTGGWQPIPPVLTRRRLKQLGDWFFEQYGGFCLTYQAFIVRCQ